MRTGLLLVGGLGLIVVSSIITTRKSPEERAAIEQRKRDYQERKAREDAAADTKFEDMYRTLETTGLLERLEPPSTAYVNSLIWRASNVDVKQGITKTLSWKFQQLGHSGRVTVIDYQSGRKLATYSSLSGFEVE